MPPSTTGGPFGRTKGAKRVVAVDVTGLPIGALAVPASTHENIACHVMLDHLSRQGVADRLELVLVDRGVTAAAATRLGRCHGLQVRRVGWDDKQPVFRPIRHAWRVEVAHGRLGRSRSLAKLATVLTHLTRTSEPAVGQGSRVSVRRRASTSGQSVAARQLSAVAGS